MKETRSSLHFWTSAQALHFLVYLLAPDCLSFLGTCLAIHRESSSKSWTSQEKQGTFSCSPASSSDSLCRSCFRLFFCHGRDQTLSGSMPLFYISESYYCFELDRVWHHMKALHPRWVHLKIQLVEDLRISMDLRTLATLSKHCSVSFSRSIISDLSEAPFDREHY